MAKSTKPIDSLAPGERTSIDGWTFTAGEESVIGSKQYDPSVFRDVTGKDLADALACAQEVDRVVQARAAGRSEQNKVAADALRAQADVIEAS